MKNYAEEIAYLYFRLNGFFLLDNYVTHAGELEQRYHMDSDLIGIRTPHVYEDIGLNGPDKLDPELRNLMGQSKFIGLICEVKGGQNSDWTLETAHGRILSSINRMGLTPREKNVEIAAQLQDSPSYTVIADDAEIRFIKVIATDKMNHFYGNSWNQISIAEMIAFIDKRARDFPVKGQGWHFYSSNLFQHLLRKTAQHGR